MEKKINKNGDFVLMNMFNVENFLGFFGFCCCLMVII